MPSFKINNWKLNVNKKKLIVSIKAENLSNSSYYARKMTNKDIAEGGFKLIDDIDDLYASLTEGSNPCQEAVKLSMSDDGHLTISQKVKQADREKVLNSEITLEKRDPKATYTSKDHKILQAKVAELENEITALKTSYENSLEETKKTNEVQVNRTKSLEEEIANLKKSFEEYEKKRLSSNFYFVSNPNFDVLNIGKRAVSKSNEYHSIFLFLPLTKGVTYSFRIIGDNFIMIGLIPETSPKVDLAYDQTGAFGYGCDGWIRPGGKSLLPLYKNGDILGINLTSDGKASFSLNGQWVYTNELQCNVTNYHLFLYTNGSSSLGAELV